MNLRQVWGFVLILMVEEGGWSESELKRNDVVGRWRWIIDGGGFWVWVRVSVVWIIMMMNYTLQYPWRYTWRRLPQSQFIFPFILFLCFECFFTLSFLPSFCHLFSTTILHYHHITSPLLFLLQIHSLINNVIFISKFN